MSPLAHSVSGATRTAVVSTLYGARRGPLRAKAFERGHGAQLDGRGVTEAQSIGGGLMMDFRDAD